MKFSYNLFVQRKNFDIQLYFKNNPESSYEQFSKFLQNKLVCPPTEAFFLNEKSKFIDKYQKSKVVKPIKKSRRKRNTIIPVEKNINSDNEVE